MKTNLPIFCCIILLFTSCNQINVDFITTEEKDNCGYWEWHAPEDQTYYNFSFDYYRSRVGIIPSNRIDALIEKYPDIKQILKYDDDTAYNYMISNKITPTQYYVLWESDFESEGYYLDTVLLLNNRFTLLSHFTNNKEAMRRNLSCVLAKNNIEFYNNYEKIFPIDDEAINILLINLAYNNETNLYTYLENRNTLEKMQLEELINYLVWHERWEDINKLKLSDEMKVYFLIWSAIYNKTKPLYDPENKSVIYANSGKILEAAVVWGSYHSVEALISIGIDINQSSENTGEPIIYEATHHGGKFYHPIMVLLLSKGAKCEKDFIRAALNDAIFSIDSIDYQKYYLSLGVKYDPIFHNYNQDSILIALFRIRPINYLEKAKFLIKNGIDQEYRNKEGKTFKDYATEQEIESLNQT